MKWFFAINAVLLETSVLTAVMKLPWWYGLILFVIVAWWQSVVVHSWTYWTS